MSKMKDKINLLPDTIFEIRPWPLRWLLNIFFFAPVSLPALLAITIVYSILEATRYWWTRLVWPTFTGKEPELYKEIFVSKLY